LHVDFIINETHKVKFLVDTGASVNIIPKQIFDMINTKQNIML